jgi:hypothetical protein
MEIKKVINSKNLPSRMPLLGTIVYATALDYWNAPQWAWGAVGLLIVVAWIGWIVAKVREEEQDDIFETPQKVATKSKFKEKLKEAMDASDRARA